MKRKEPETGSWITLIAEEENDKRAMTGTCHPRLSFAEPPWQRDVPALPYSLASYYSLPTPALERERLVDWLLTLL